MRIPTRTLLGTPTTTHTHTRRCGPSAAFGGLGLIMLAGVSTALAQQDPGEYVRSYTVSGRAQVVVRTDDGHVHITTTDGNQVELRVRRTGSLWGLGMGEPPHNESHQVGDRVELTVRSRWHILIMGGDSHESQIEVRMPRNADLKIDSHDAGVDLGQLAGDINVHTFNGPIRAQELSGRIELQTFDGGITGQGLEGEIKLGSFNGAIHATRLAGRCEASTHDGPIELAGRFELLDTTSFNGGILAHAEPGSHISSDWRLSSHDGRVQLGLPRDVKASVDASSHDGPIELRLPIAVEGPLSRSHLHGALNGGGPDVIIHSFNGRIVLEST